MENQFDISSEDARRFVAHFDDLELEVIRRHVAIQQILYRRLAARLGCDLEELPDLRFMSLARLALAGQKSVPKLLDTLQKLDSARNVIAHEQDSAKFIARFHEFLRCALGAGYTAAPSSSKEAIDQDWRALEFIHAWIANL